MELPLKPLRLTKGQVTSYEVAFGKSECQVPVTEDQLQQCLDKVLKSPVLERRATSPSKNVIKKRKSSFGALLSRDELR